MACCQEFDCQIPPFRCNCQERCWYDAHHQPDGEDDPPPIDPATFYATCIADCPAESIVPDVAPIADAVQVEGYISAWPLNPASLDTAATEIEDCKTDCGSVLAGAVDACDTTLTTCTAACTDDPCRLACIAAKWPCYDSAFQDANDCEYGCLTDAAAKTALKKTANQVTDCQGESDVEPDQKLKLAECLRHAGSLHIDAVWGDLTTYAGSTRTCHDTFSTCMAAAAGGAGAGAACEFAEWTCLRTARATFLRAVEPAEEDYGTARANCLRDWLSADGEPPSLDRPEKKLPVCDWQFLAALKARDFKANARRLNCEADLEDCASACNPLDPAATYTPCVAPCDAAAIHCLDADVNRARIDDRIKVCRDFFPRLPVAAHEGDPKHPHDYEGDQCRAQCGLLSDTCDELLALALAQCTNLCCGDADCIAACEADVIEPSDVGDPHPCADTLHDCVAACDFDRGCIKTCFTDYRTCIFTVPGDYVVCQREVHETVETEGCRRFGCSGLLGDCPSCESIAAGNSDGLLGLTGDWWDLQTSTLSVSFHGCD